MALCLAAVILLGTSGCKAMANPDGTDLPWGERPSWEFAPNVPQSMLPQ
jgi:hypothetical protein